MTENLFPALVLAALTLGALHTLAPDHWVPFAALGRARRWSVRRTAGVTLLCGLGHVTVSALLGLGGVFLGAALLETWGTRLEALAGLLLLAFGGVYSLWGLHRATTRRLPGLGSPTDASRLPVASLFVLFALDPCVPLIPVVVAAAALGTTPLLGVVAVYALTTLTTMTLLAATARAGAGAVRAPTLNRWLDRWGHAAAGALILLVGAVVGLVGI